MMNPLNFEARVTDKNLTLAIDSQAMISYKLLIRDILGLFDRMTPYLTLEDVTWQPFCFQNKAKIFPRQAFLAIYILCKSDETSCNILSFRTY